MFLLGWFDLLKCLFLFLAILTQSFEWIRIHKAIDLAEIASTRHKNKNLVWLIFISPKDCFTYQRPIRSLQTTYLFYDDNLNDYLKENLQYSIHLFSYVTRAIMLILRIELFYTHIKHPKHVPRKRIKQTILKSWVFPKLNSCSMWRMTTKWTHE